MTRILRCRDIEGLLLESEDRALAAEERRDVEEHLHRCGRCRGFAADRALIREELAAVRWPAPPDELVLRTQRIARGIEPETFPAAVPAWVFIALALVTIVTATWLAVSLADITPDMALADLPIAALAAVFVIVQNALMLFFAPVVLRAFRTRRREPASAR
jgi:predicted anti-sigma-YlaC factor YlaD